MYCPAFVGFESAIEQGCSLLDFLDGLEVEGAGRLEEASSSS